MLDELWDEQPPPTASTALQGHVSQLRKILPADRLVTRPPGYLLRVERGERDVDRFEELRALARSTPERASELLRDALALWRGPALADLADEPFARDEIARLENLRIETLEERIEADLQGWSNPDIVAELETLVARYPLRERLAAQLMRALYRSGRQAEALSAYRRARSNLVNELGIEPTPALRDLHRAILSHDTAVLLPGPRGRSAKVDLPAEPNRFVGRRRELSEVCSELEQYEIRLLTLTGAGGSGKTRIATRAAAERAGAYGDGVRFIALAGAQRVAPAIVAGLGLLETPGVEPSDALQSYLAGRHVLLVLDNFEHLLDEAPLLAGLLARNASLQLLVTSREPLRLTAEHEYQVPPLAEEEAVQLFVDRARAVTRDFAANGEVAQICRRLDSLPLAVELAAARARSLSAREILDRLDSSLAFLKDGPRDAPERQQTLRATIEWSRRLLPPAEQRIFLGLGVFTGGCTRDAAATVCGADAKTLKSLVEKNLLRAHSGRWSMLETIREYAAYELDSSGDGARRRQLHAGYFIELAERAAPELRRGTSDRLWLDLLTRERANLHAALEWLAERGDGEAAQRLVRALFHFWHDRGPIHEAFESFGRALALPSSPATRAAALCHGSVFAAWASGHDVARAWAEEGLPAARAAHDHLSVVAALQILGFYLLTEQRDKGAELLEEAVSVARASGEAWAVGITLFTLLNCLVIDDPERAVALGEQAAALENISTSLRAMIVGARAEIAEWHGDLERAVELNREGLTLARRVGSHNDFLYLSSLGWLALLQGDAHEACLLLAESLHLARETGARDRAALILMFLSAAAAARGQPLVAGTLHGAVRTHHANVANVPGWSLYRDQISTYLSNARKEAGDYAWAAAVERGETLTVDDASRYALDAVS